MEELINDFDNFKISAFAKLRIINQTNGSGKKTISQAQTFVGPHSTSKPSDPNPNNSDIPTNVHLHKIANEVEVLRREKVHNAVNKRIHLFMEHTEKQKANNKRDWEIRQNNLLDKLEQEEVKIWQALEENEREKMEHREKLIAYYKELAERKKQNDEKIKQNEQRRKLQAELINRIKNNQVEFREVYQEIVTLFRNCKHQIEIKKVLEDVRQQLQSLPDCMNEVVESFQNGRISEKDLQKTAECIDQIKSLKDAISRKLQLIEFEKNKEEEEKAKAAQVANSNIKASLVEETSDKPDSTANQGNAKDAGIINKYMAKSSIKYYSELQDFLQNYPSLFKNLLENDSLKQFRFDCKKAINIPVNAISAVSSEHLTDKYNRLTNLLLGNKVVVGGTEVMASKHPDGIAFCKDILAKKFVLQGDLMISSKPEAAFCYATIILSLWNQFPDFGTLFILHLHNECPYLIPFYPPRLVEQSDEEYYKSQGYHYVDGTVEKQDKFLKRMTGIMRLYAAIIVAKPKRDQKSSPHNITYGWRWLSAFLNLEPRIDISATMIHIFLEIAGSAMQTVYGKQFRKLMDFLCNVYMPMLQKFDSGGPFTRLEVLLQDYQKTRRFEQPKGTLSSNFW